MMHMRVVLTSVAAALLLLSGASAAWGHASQVSSTPAAGESVPALPAEIVIAFDSTVMKAGLAVVVRDSEGAIVGDAQPKVVRNEVRVGLPSDEDASGTFAVAYRVVSEDGHAITGQFDFTVEGDGNPAMAAETPAQSVGQDAVDASTGVSMSPIILSLLVLATIGLVLALRWRGGKRIG